MNIRVGFGFDVHQLTEGRDLWLGGVKIEHPKGALGHSDADVLLHAICDALLGAANMLSSDALAGAGALTAGAAGALPNILSSDGALFAAGAA